VVTCNYQMTVDPSAETSPGLTRMLVLDTRGINVWCAGKGTFGTDELVRRILPPTWPTSSTTTP
jgi:hypothetical protein